MDNFLRQILLTFIAVIIGLAIALIWKRVHMRNTMRTRPTEEEREKLIAKVNDLKKEGCSYEERKKYLLQQGLNSDNAEELIGEAERLYK